MTWYESKITEVIAKFVMAVFLGVIIAWLTSCAAVRPTAHDPGLRVGSPGAGGPLASVTPSDGSNLANFNQGLAQFTEVEPVAQGLGPRYNNASCSNCHSQPAIGGTSPAVNPAVAAATLNSATNKLPSFETLNGPTREVRFRSDGSVHDLFTITGRPDAAGCNLAQPDFSNVANLSFRIPTPLFGSGLVENIDDATILANQKSTAAVAKLLGIAGHPNRNGNDGTITRFGWKAQNKSLLLFAGEAYNVEMGITNPLFQTERPSPDEASLPVTCKLNTTPEDNDDPFDIVAFEQFMKLLAPPQPAAPTAVTTRGNIVFAAIGCATCHTPFLKTAPSSVTAGLGGVQANLFSDLLVHHMGTGLADGITQGTAGPDEFRTAPLWGVGQRIFFLHDGRTTDLVQAIEQHRGRGSEANKVIRNFNRLPASDQQAVIEFLRSL